ncbi:MAG: exo-alpha-sialidase [Bacteroidaceae bacterium]|nr:exo-alpha-sialidase [Bacteroidaceae bacterium]
MNIQSIILLAVVILVAAYVLYRYLHSGKKCSCCDGCNKDCCSAHVFLLLLLPMNVAISFAQDVDATTGASELQPQMRAEKQILAYSNDSTRDVYRIPAIAKNKKGELVAIYDYRVCGTDIGFGEVDQVMRISRNNGRKWSEETKIADGIGGNDNVFGVGFGDPALCLDRESGRGVLITVSGKCIYGYAKADHRPFIARQITTDGGHTWSAPEDITQQFWGREGALFQKGKSDDGMGVFAWAGFFGSGKILQSRVTKVGDYYRLYAALLLRGTGLKGAYVVYSDDMGMTWQLLGGDATVQAAPDSDEPKVEELPSGQIVLSGRKWYGRTFNVWTFAEGSITEGSWDTPVNSHDFPTGIKVGANSCNGEILIVRGRLTQTGKRCHVALQSLPKADTRADVSIFYKVLEEDKKYTSAEFAEDWKLGLQVTKKRSAYSTMCLQKDGRIAFFYEEEPYIFNMVYVPLTLSQATSGAVK